MAYEKGLHDGHRDRLREKFLKNGFDDFEDHQILEMYLFYCIPRKDTNGIAHRLINRFGSISAVFDAPLASLMECGISKNAAVMIKMLPSVLSVYVNDRFNNENEPITEENIADRILPHYFSVRNEQVFLLLMDSAAKELYSGIISKGSINASEIYTRKIIELALRYNANAAVIAHNHPSGVALPSKGDLNVTRQLKEALATIGVKLLDHFIITEHEFVSLAGIEHFQNLFL